MSPLPPPVVDKTTMPPPPPPPTTTTTPSQRSALQRWRDRCVTALAAFAVAIAVVALIGAAQGYRPVVLQTGSMGDAAPAGSLLITQPKPADSVAVGDVLVMRNEGRTPVTHRVIELEDTAVGTVARTQGDANEFADPSPYALSDDELVARWIVPGAGTWLERARGPELWIALAALVAVALAAVALRRVWAQPGTPGSPSPNEPARGAARISRTRMAIAVITVASLIGAGVVFSLFTSIAQVQNNQFGASACFSTEVKSVQTGTTVLTGDGTVTETISAVSPTRAFVTASVRSNSTEITDSSAQVVLDGPTSLTITRATDTGVPPAVTVAWSVVEYLCGVTVQRGITAGDGTNGLDVTISDIDPAASFVLLNTLAPATAAGFGPDDLAHAEVTTATNLSISGSSTAVFSAGRSFAWQVVSFDDPDDASVQYVSASLGSGDGSTSITLPTTVDRRSTFITAWVTSDATGTSIDDRLVRAVLVDGSTVQIDRSDTGTVLDIDVQVVTLAAGATVQHGIVDFPSGTPSVPLDFDAVDVTRSSIASTVAVPGPLAGGQTDHAADATIGEASATFAFSGPSGAVATRDATASNASFSWQVIEWTGPAWWDIDWGYRQRIDVAAGTDTPDGYTVPVTIDHADLVGNDLARTDGNDMRVLRWDGVSWVELDRVLDDDSAWNAANSTFLFRTTEAIDTDTAASYWLYFDNAAAGPAPNDPEQVFLLVEDFDTGTLGDFEDRTGNTGWYEADPWTRRIDVTVPAGRVGSDLSDVPLLVSLTSTDLRDEAQADGSDIRFTAADGTTPLPHEVERYDSGTGSLTAWVRVPTVTAAAPTVVAMFYGAPNAPSQQDPAATWPETSGAIWHLDRDPAGTAPQLDDVSRANLDGLSVGTMTTADLIDARVGHGVAFDGVDDALVTNGQGIAGTGAFTVSAWIRPASLSADMAIIDHAADGSTRSLDLRVSPTGALHARVELDSGTVTASSPDGTITTGTWQHVAARWDGSTLDVVVDGSVTASSPAVGTPLFSTAMPLIIGDAVTSDAPFDGDLDELRIELTDRSNDWLAAAVANQADPATFLSIGTPSAVTAFVQGAWGARKPISVDADFVDTDLTDFALLVDMTDAQIQAGAQACGCDLVFTAGDGVTRLDHAIEAYDAGTGSLTAWVRVPLVNSTSNTRLFVYYTNPTAVDQQDPAAVFGPDADLQLLGDI